MSNVPPWANQKELTKEQEMACEIAALRRVIIRLCDSQEELDRATEYIDYCLDEQRHLALENLDVIHKTTRINIT